MSSVDWAISLVLMPIGFVLAGPLADAIRIDAVLALAAAFCIVPNLAILLLPSVRSLRRLDHVQAEGEAPATASQPQPAG